MFFIVSASAPFLFRAVLVLCPFLHQSFCFLLAALSWGFFFAVLGGSGLYGLQFLKGGHIATGLVPLLGGRQLFLLFVQQGRPLVAIHNRDKRMVYHQKQYYIMDTCLQKYTSEDTQLQVQLQINQSRISLCNIRFCDSDGDFQQISLTYYISYFKTSMGRFAAEIVILFAIVGFTCQISTFDNLGTGSININVNTTYTWSITLDTNVNLANINLTFPSACTLSSSTNAYLSGNATALNPTFTGSTLIIANTANLLGTITLTVTNVLNPNSAITTFSFFFSTFNETIALSQSKQLLYTSGTLASARWAFSLCTEQPNSVLTVTVTIASPIPLGSNKFIITYGTWDNLASKNLLTDVATGGLTGMVSFDGGSTNITASVTFDTTKQRITVSYSQNATLASGSALVVMVSGVQSPPTQSTPSSTYWVATADTNGAFFDQSSSLTIASTCIYTISSGSYSPTSPAVNSNSYGPTILFSQTPTITILNGDAVEVYFTPLGNLVSCSTLKIWRYISEPMQASYTTTTSFLSFTIGSSNTPNTQYGYNISLNLDCSSVGITGSETKVDLVFKFKRNSAYYLQLETQMTPAATIIPTSKAYVAVSTAEMTMANVTYTLSIVTSQPLGQTPALLITVPAGVTVPASPTCTVTLSSGSVSGTPSCLFSASTLSVNFSSSSATISSGTNITVTVLGLTNPSSPSTLSLGISTYYSSLITSSRVQYNSAAFPVSYVGITNYPVSFSPSTFRVYSSTATTLTLTTSVDLPSGCSIYVQYPSAASALAITSTPLKINNVTASTSSGTANGNNSYNVVTGTAISANSELVLLASITSPSALDTYSFVKVIIYKGTTAYLSSTSSITMSVSTVNSISVALLPSPPKAGSTASYSITLAMTVPHPANFYLEAYLPADVVYTSTGSSCSGACNSTVSSSNSSYFKVNVTNSAPFSTGHSLTLVLTATFANPRAVGTGMLWNLTTSTISPANLITSSQSYPTISDPNSLAVSFLTDSYFKGSTSPVKVSFTFTNSPVQGDILELFISTNTYYQGNTSVSCSAYFGSCSKNANSTTALLIVTIVPDVSIITNKILSLVLEGLVSGTNVADSIPVKMVNASSNLIEEGTLTYQVSCRDGTTTSILNNCMTCYSNGSCIECYTENGFYLSSSLICVTDCGKATSYLAYSSNSTYTCQTCTSNCLTCSSLSVCITCIGSYYFYQHNSSCLSTCDPNGFITQANMPELICVQCYGGGLCMQCTTSSIGDCTLCVGGTVLSQGQCLTNCTNTSMYASGGICYPCDSSCATCFAGTSSGCFTCAANYYNYTSTCVSSCPSGTAANSVGVCTCASPCSKCENSTSYCTACINSSLFVSSGQCLSSCPSQSYLSAGTCISCKTGCKNCSATTCYSCLSGNYLYNNICYSDCNLIGQQYDISGSSCVLCPDGCDTCSGTTCSSCLSQYSLSDSSSQCIKTCLKTNTCDITGEQVLPLPGLITVLVWTAIAIAIKVILHKNYLPYSMILFNSVVQLVLVVALIASSPNLVSYARLLVPSDSQRTTIRALLGVYVATNYLTNIAYIVIFIRYIKPLLTNPRQIDTISNAVAIIVGTVTNYRFALIAYAKMFPKPSIHISNGSKLTPVHYLCIVSILLDVLPIAACSMAIYQEQSKTNLFMLAVDLLLVIVLNVIVTIWFVGCSKGDDYYDHDIKKYHLQDTHGTNETVPNEKNISNANMVANDTYHFTEDETTSNKADILDTSYKKLNMNNSKISIMSIRQTRAPQRKNTDDSGQEYQVIPVKGRNNTDYDPFSDPNYEVGLKPKYSGRNAEAIPTRDKDINRTNLSEGRAADQGLDLKGRTSPKNYTKHQIVNDYINETPANRLEDVEEDEDLPDLAEQSQNEGRKSVFELPREKLARPKRTGTEKKVKGHQASNKSMESPLKIMKRQKKIGYFQSDAFQSNEEDIESIIKQKVWESSIKQKQTSNEKMVSESGNTHSEIGYEQISPSWFNVQNQRIQLSDFDEKESVEP